jgi:metal-responsive CopG/Arc/MetJ family transcriptional regulator
MVVARRQTLIQLDDARLAALDQRAGLTGKSRSELIREAIDLLLGSGDAAAIDAAIVEGYRKHPPGELDAWTAAAARGVLADDPW